MLVWDWLESLLSSLGLSTLSSLGLSTRSNDDNLQDKARKIEACLAQHPVNLWELRELSLSKGGLLERKYRQEAWPMLVGLNEADKKAMFAAYASPNSITRFFHEEEKKSEAIDTSVDLIRRDVGRSVVFRYNTVLRKGQDGGQASTEVEPTTPAYASERLAQVLEHVIRSGTSLHYYQGLHDVAGVVLHNMDYQAPLTTTILQRISQSHLRDAMRENFGNITWLLSVLLLPLVEKVEPHVHYALAVTEVELSNVCLSWMITWFTHDIYHPNTAGRLVDAFLSGHPLLPLYVSVALLTHPVLKQDLFMADPADPSGMFMLVKQLPQAIGSDHGNDLSTREMVPVQELLDDALTIMKRIPPRSLLDLVDSELYSRHDLLQRVGSISMFKAPSSWSLASGSLAGGVEGVTQFDPLFVRAKLASGVPILMSPVSSAPCLTSPTWGSRRYRRKSSKLKKYKRMLLGK